MKLGMLKAIMNGLSDDSEIEINQIETYKAEIKVTTPEQYEATIGELDFSPLVETGDK